MFDYNRSVLTAKKFLKHGAYHVYDFYYSPQIQAANFLNAIGNTSAMELPPMLDIETNSKVDFNTGSYPNSQKDLLTFLNLIQDSTGLIPIIYTNKSDGNKFMPGEKFTAYPLWIAHYDPLVPQSKDLPSVWKKKSWTIWQKKPKLFDAILNDFDLFNGDMELFKAFISNSKITK